ncbi:MAG TPA: aldehyde dehydrogenase family protein [Mycobacteriales bacterium]|nr:aldehyde dehydrogenase family protein [Mycobacteriales bacterium]
MGLLDASSWSDNIFTGTWRAGGGGRAEVREPATGAVLGSVGVADPQDVSRAVALAVAAQREWAARGAFDRAAVLRRAADLFQEHADEIVEWVARESGGTRGRGRLEVHVCAEECREAAALATAPYGELLHSPQPRVSLDRRLPVGVVAVISPFNVPLVLSMRSVAPALALGNAVVLKPDLRTSVCGGVVLARILAEAGVPAGLFHMLPGGIDVGSAMIDEPRVRVVSFTGSTPAGRAVGARAAQSFTRAHLELGGNNALVVLRDANVEAAASCGAFGSFTNSGQVCMGIGRHLVHEDLYEDYVAVLAKTADGLSVGDGFREDVALGPLIDEKQLTRVHDLVERSIAGGARLVAGGTHDGLRYRPTVLADCTDETPAYADEVFGPVACVRPFSSIDEVVRLASDTGFGLSLGIITDDMVAALDIASRVPVGLVHINDQTVNDDPNAPFGGVGSSGFGRLGGVRANAEAFTETQWVTMRATPPRRPL